VNDNLEDEEKDVWMSGSRLIESGTGFSLNTGFWLSRIIAFFAAEINLRNNV